MSRTAYHARWVLPIASAPLSNAVVVVENDSIAFVGDAALAHADTHVDLGNAVLMPGLVNVHTHLELTVLRGFLEGLTFRDWLRVLTDARREVLDAQALLDSATHGIHEGLLQGITTFADASASGVPHEALRRAGVRGRAYLEVFGPDPAVAATAVEDLRQRANTMRALDSALVTTAISPHAPYTVSVPLFRAVAALALAESWPVSVHVAESRAEIEYVADGTGPFADRLRERGIPVSALGMSPIELLAQTGILDTDALLVHAVHASESDLLTVAEHGCAIAHCPVSNAKLGHGIAPIHRARAMNIATGLGSDSVASNNRMDILGEARQATLLQSILLNKADALNASEALEMATIDGARALRLDKQIGTLEPGKQADIVAFPLESVEATPTYDPQVALVHALAGAVEAKLVLVAGVPRVREGRVLDAEVGLSDRIQRIGNALEAWRPH